MPAFEALEVPKFRFTEASLLEYRAESTRRNVSSVHGQISLAAICMTQHEMGPALASLLKTRTPQLLQNLFRFVGHQDTSTLASTASDGA